jgi:beta-lactam-binding protein with PASTA domain
LDKKIPDLTSYRLDEAENILKKNGILFSLKKTAPFSRMKHSKNEVSIGQYRVLKQIEQGNLLVIIFAEEAC